jgi:hypothetical protein
MDPTKEQHQILCKSKSVTEILAMIRQAFGEKARAVYGQTEKGETSEEQSQEQAHHFL